MSKADLMDSKLKCSFIEDQSAQQADKPAAEAQPPPSSVRTSQYVFVFGGTIWEYLQLEMNSSFGWDYCIYTCTSLQDGVEEVATTSDGNKDDLFTSVISAAPQHDEVME